jgi:hypothetical protein
MTQRKSMYVYAMIESQSHCDHNGASQQDDELMYKHAELWRKSMPWPVKGKEDPIATVMVPANRIIRFNNYSSILLMVQRNTMPQSKNFLRQSFINSASQGFTTIYMPFPLYWGMRKIMPHL